MIGRIKETVIRKLYYGRTAYRDKQVLIGEHLHEPCIESGLNSMMMMMMRMMMMRMRMMMMMMMIVSKSFENFTKFSYLGRTVTQCNKYARIETPTAVSMVIRVL
jgi:hypothetical protein